MTSRQIRIALWWLLAFALAYVTVTVARVPTYQGDYPSDDTSNITSQFDGSVQLIH